MIKLKLKNYFENRYYDKPIPKFNLNEEEFNKIFLRIEEINSKHSTYKMYKGQTQLSLVVPMLTYLGYDVFNPLEVESEYVVPGIGEIDFGIKVKDKTQFVISIKKFKTNLSDKDSIEKNGINHLKTVMDITGVEVGVLTNGNDYWLVTKHKNIRLIKIEDFREEQMERLVYLSKAFIESSID